MPFITLAKTFRWTNHSREKMRFYRLSEARVKRVINSPKRIEEGIAPKTVAIMQPTSYKSIGKESDWNQEIWVMIQHPNSAYRTRPSERKVVKIISAWRYPGKTKPRDEVVMDFLRQEYKKCAEEL